VEVDPLEGKRLHAWVVVLEGKRGVEAPFHVEASTGAVFSAREAPYLTVDFVYSNVNFWVNVQGSPLLPRQSLAAGAPLPGPLRAMLAAAAAEAEAGGAGGALAAGAAAGLALASGEGAAAGAAYRPELASPFVVAIESAFGASQSLAASAAAAAAAVRGRGATKTRSTGTGAGCWRAPKWRYKARPRRCCWRGAPWAAGCRPRAACGGT
jgi:hypothetical protein